MNKLIVASLVGLFALSSPAATRSKTVRATMCAAWDGTFEKSGQPHTYRLVASIQGMNADEVTSAQQDGLDQALEKCQNESQQPQACHAVTCVNFNDTRRLPAPTPAPAAPRPSAGNSAICAALGRSH